MTEPGDREDPTGPGAVAEPVEPGDDDAIDDAEATDADDPKAKKKKKDGSFLKELPFLLLIAFVLALVIKAFLIQAFSIPSSSRETTLHGCPGCTGDRVLVNKVVYKLRDINRGEIVVFNGLDSFTPEVQTIEPKGPVQKARQKLGDLLGLGTPSETDFIKRVIGLPGDTVACCTNGHVTVNGVELDEPYLFEDDHQTFDPVTVPEGKLFVMGDHRSRSSDSRVHGPVPVDKVVGRAFVVVWPVSRMKGLPVPGEIEDAKIPEALPAPAWSVAATPPAGGLLLALPVTGVRRRVRRRRAARRTAASPNA
jgi:signal peptidase I